MTTTAVVTGAASGIGRATALLLASRGMRVAAADLDEAGARETAGMAGGLTAYRVDITDDDAVTGLRDAVAADLGAAVVLVNCAGWDEAMPFVDTAPAFWRQVVEVNLLGMIAMTHAFLPGMIEAGAGRLVNVASDAGRVGSSGETVYAGAKGGVIAFTKSVGREVARHGITANAVCPGPTDTPLFNRQPERVREALIKAIPFRRLGRPEDVAAAIAFFAGDGAAYITGQVLSVSGGLTMHG